MSAKDETAGSVIPMGEKGETRPLSIAFHKDLLQRVDRVGRETRNNRSDTIRHLVRFALDSYEKKRVSAESRGEGRHAG